MIEMYRSKWQARDEWFRWCEDVPQVELTALRTGGAGSIMACLFQVVDTEQYWIRALAYGTEHHYDYAEYNELDALRTLSKRLRPLAEETLRGYSPDIDDSVRYVELRNGDRCGYAYGEVLRKLIAHEWHSYGQLSIWAVELGMQPPSVGLPTRLDSGSIG